MNKQENGADKTVLAAIETIEVVDFLLITQLTAWFVLSGYLTPSDNSSQFSIGMTFPQTQQAGTIVHLEDSEGNTVLTFAPSKEYQSVVISSPELKESGSYTLYSGGNSTGTEVDGIYTDGKYDGGTKVTEFKITSSVTWLNESGVTTGGGSNRQGPGGGRR